MLHPYIDLHTHSTFSDGCLPADELIFRAQEAGIGILAITDHNRTAALPQVPGIRLIQGSEISCLHPDSRGVEHEIHVIALGFDPQHPKMQAVFRHNQPDRRPYINAILARLRTLGIDIGTYEDIRAAVPDSRHFGRMQIAKMMRDQGYVSSVGEAFDLYIGAHGQRRAYVANPLRYVSMEQTVDAILAAGGVPVLAHLYYYQLSQEENLHLLRSFRDMAGSRGAMEVEYGQYTRAQRDDLRRLADEYGLMYSCASDFHGQSETETLAHHFDAAICEKLLACLPV